jgi:error-prone DNA polymerase
VFAELLARSCFSFLRGASHPEELVGRAQELGLAAIALSDLGGLYGAVRALHRAREIGQRVIVGAELTLDLVAGAKEQGDLPTVVLLVKDHDGYRNLCQLITLGHADRPKGESAISLDALARHAAGLVAVVPAPHVPGGSDMPPPPLLGMLRESYRERAFLGIHRHLEKHDKGRMESVIEGSRRYALPILASARPLYHHRSRKLLADVLHCIRHQTTLDQAGTELGMNAEAVLRSEQALRRLFPEHPDWVERTAEVAEELRFRLDELAYRFPCRLLPGETADQKLHRLVWEGARRRYPEEIPESVAQQLNKELRLIQELGMAPYFLSTWEIVEMARRRRILCQGRGSAANSAVCYVLGITAVDPARSSLLFERFMSVERREPPDIDIDFEHERREEIIQEIYETYGRDRAAMVSEVICYRGKSALREVGKALGLTLEQVDRLSRSITHWDPAELASERLRDAGFDPGDGRLRRVLRLAQVLRGFPRHLSIHVGGFVLSEEPLSEVAPVEPARMPGRTVIPWDKDDLETLGFFKVDILGLGILTAIRRCLELVVHSGGLGGSGESFDPLEGITRIPAEDPAVYELVSQADTVGVFQIESRAQMTMLPRLRPARFYDLVIEVAIVRPGPIQGGMVHPYLRRRNGEEPVFVPHPDLWSILERTLGVPLFQEQVMQIAIVGAGYSGGEADELRRDMAAWKKSGRLLRHRERLFRGFARRGIPEKFGAALFEQIKGFGEYGFPESHAASFALLVYTSAWLKVHYPAHFVAAALNSQPMGFYSPSALVQDAARHGVEVRDVCAAKSDWDSTLEEPGPGSSLAPGAPGRERALRLGFRLVKGLGQARVAEWLSARQKKTWQSLDDLVERSCIRRDELGALAQAGALEMLVPGRRQALWAAWAPRVPGLFRGRAIREPETELPALGPLEQLVLDYERKGLSVRDHPLAHLRPMLARQMVITARELGLVDPGREVRVAGLVTCRQQPYTAKGVVFLTLEDETGSSNLILRPHIFARYRREAIGATLLLARGKVERVGSQTNTAAVIHVLVSSLERVGAPGLELPRQSRDFC